MNKINKSIELFKEAKLHMPGGVNSPVRAFKNIDGNPIFFKKAKGAYVFDADNNKYIDYIGSWGPMIMDPMTLCSQYIYYYQHQKHMHL